MRNRKARARALEKMLNGVSGYDKGMRGVEALKLVKKAGENMSEHKFKVGDRVKVTKPAHRDCVWMENQEPCHGNTYEVIGTHRSCGGPSYFLGEIGDPKKEVAAPNWFSEAWLEAAPAPGLGGLCIGDLVEPRGTTYRKIQFKITSFNGNLVLGDKDTPGGWFYSNLVRVSEEPKPKKDDHKKEKTKMANYKPGDRVVLLDGKKGMGWPGAETTKNIIGKEVEIHSQHKDVMYGEIAYFIKKVPGDDKNNYEEKGGGSCWYLESWLAPVVLPLKVGDSVVMNATKEQFGVSWESAWKENFGKTLVIMQIYNDEGKRLDLKGCPRHVNSDWVTRVGDVPLASDLAALKRAFDTASLSLVETKKDLAEVQRQFTNLTTERNRIMTERDEAQASLKRARGLCEAFESWSGKLVRFLTSRGQIGLADPAETTMAHISDLDRKLEETRKRDAASSGHVFSSKGPIHILPGQRITLDNNMDIYNFGNERHTFRVTSPYEETPRRPLMHRLKSAIAERTQGSARRIRESFSKGYDKGAAFRARVGSAFVKHFRGLKHWLKESPNVPLILLAVSIVMIPLSHYRDFAQRMERQEEDSMSRKQLVPPSKAQRRAYAAIIMLGAAQSPEKPKPDLKALPKLDWH